jgi:DNA-binding LacI/PurR family transcriptional regulator
VGWDTPRAEVGAAQTLVDAIAGRPAGEMVIEPRLHVRSSTAPAPL